MGSEESFTMLNVSAESAVPQQEQQFQLEHLLHFVLWHHGSGSTTGHRSNVSRQTAEDQGEQDSSDFARHDAEDLNNTGVLQSVRVWTDNTDANADTWKAAIRHFSKVVCVILFFDGN